jgi:hypothetical protein
MAQIIKHRRGGITSLKDVTARKGEFIIATGSIGDMNGPWVFVGDTDGVAGAYKATSKIYQGGNVPSISVGSYGSTVDGTPFYSTNAQTLYILSSAGNTAMDLTGNIEGNLISGVTINNLTGTTANITAVSSSMFTGSFTGNGGGLYNIPASGVTGLQLDKIADGAATASIDETDGLRVNIKTEITGSLIVSGNTSVSGITNLGDDLNVTGDTVLNGSVTVTGLTDNRLVVVGSGGLLEDDSNLTFDGTVFQIGQGQLEVDVATGELRTSGSIIMKGNVTIGDQNTDNIILAGEVSSSIIPDVNNAFDLGSSSQAWRNLHVSGTAYIETLNAANISLSGITVFDDLTVEGDTTLGNSTGDTVSITGSVYLQSLTEKRLVVVGADGLLTDYSGLTFDNGNLNLSGALEVTNIQGTGSLYLKPDKLDSRHFEIYNSAGPSGYTDIHFVGNADLNFFGDDTNYLKIDNTISKISIESSGGVNINTSGSFNLYTHDGDDIYMSSSSDITLEADTDVTITAGDDLRMYSNDIFSLRNYSSDENITLVTKYNSGDEKTMSFDVNGNLTIPGGFTGSYADINTQAQLASAAVEDLTDNRIVLAGSGGELEDDVNFTFDGTTFNIGQGDFEVDVNDGDIRTSGSLTVVSSTTLKNNLSVSGTTTVSGTTELQSTLTVISTSELKGAVGINSTLDVTGSVNLKSTLDVDGQATLNTAVVENLTTGRVVLVGTGSTLIDDSDFTFDGLVLKVGDGNFEVDVTDGDVRTSGSLTTNGLTNNGDLTVNGVLTVTGNTQLQANLYVSGNLEVLGGATNVTIQSTTIELDDNIIRLNAYSPFERYAGFEVIDSGSSGVSASLVWDSLNDYWMFVSSSGDSSKLIGTTAGTYGSEISLTNNTFPIATGANTIGDSLLTMVASGTTLAFNTNKFTIASGDGATSIAGNVTVTSGGGADAASNSSAIVFRNSSNVLGYVSTTTSTVETAGLLGYKQSDGALVFSDLIDGGSY